MAKKALSEDQIRAYLSKVVRDFAAHGKTMRFSDIEDLAKLRLQEGAPYLGQYFRDWEARDYATLLQVLAYNKAVEAAAPEEGPADQVELDFSADLAGHTPVEEDFEEVPDVESLDDEVDLEDDEL